MTWQAFCNRPSTSPVELYNLQTDPDELTNLAGRPECAAVQAGLEAKVVTWMRETGDPLLDGPIASPPYRKAMRKLSA